VWQGRNAGCAGHSGRPGLERQGGARARGGECALSARFAAIATKVCRPFRPESPFGLYAANSQQ
jgi:hypothetical protein